MVPHFHRLLMRYPSLSLKGQPKSCQSEGDGGFRFEIFSGWLSNVQSIEPCIGLMAAGRRLKSRCCCRLPGATWRMSTIPPIGSVKHLLSPITKGSRLVASGDLPRNLCKGRLDIRVEQYRGMKNVLWALRGCWCQRGYMEQLLKRW